MPSRQAPDFGSLNRLWPQPVGRSKTPVASGISSLLLPVSLAWPVPPRPGRVTFAPGVARRRLSCTPGISRTAATRPTRMRSRACTGLRSAPGSLLAPPKYAYDCRSQGPLVVKAAPSGSPPFLRPSSRTVGLPAPVTAPRRASQRNCSVARPAAQPRCPNYRRNALRRH